MKIQARLYICRPSAKRRGQHDLKRRWDRVERGAADLKGYALCRRPRCGFGWPEDGFWVVWGWFLGDLGSILEGSEASWKGLESLGGLWRGLGTPRSQDFEDVSSRLLDSGGPGTGRTMVVALILCALGPLRNQYLETEDQTSDHRDLRTVL